MLHETQFCNTSALGASEALDADVVLADDGRQYCSHDVTVGGILLVRPLD